MNPESPRVPDYELLQRIGGGAYGEVWLGRSTTGAFRAVKLVYRHTFEDARPFDREFKGIQHFERISREHPSQLALFHVGRNDVEAYFYYVMKLADPAPGARADRRSQLKDGDGREKPEAGLRPVHGTAADLKAPAGAQVSELGTANLEPGSSASHLPSSTSQLRPYTPHTLRHDLKGRGRLPVREAFEIGLALSEALAHLHGHGLVHRDIKPSNIIFVGGRPKLADIGLVTDTGDSRSMVGTEGYLPPEGVGTPAADVYAMGMVLYEALTGLDRHQFPNLPADLMSWPDAKAALELNEIILKACARDPKDRYPNAEPLRAELAHLRDGGSIRRRRGWTRVMGRGKRAALGAAAAVLTVAALTSVWRWTVGEAAWGGSTRSVFVLPFRYVAPDAEPVTETEQNLWLRAATSLPANTGRQSTLFCWGSGTGPVPK
jgi:eukaryotic-like serine/threonine-protein kinase